jgi:fructose-1-phosphate kinase PfkB-like protein
MLIAGPNLTIDRTLTIAALRPGEVLRFDEAVITPGGKGVNVARTALALGAPAVLVGLVPGHTGAAVAAMLAAYRKDGGTVLMASHDDSFAAAAATAVTGMADLVAG